MISFTTEYFNLSEQYINRLKRALLYSAGTIDECLVKLDLVVCLKTFLPIYIQFKKP